MTSSTGSDPYLRNNEIKRFLSSRGCPFQCTYCFNRAYKQIYTDLETVDLNIRCKVDNPIATLFQPYPRTKLGEYAVKAGFFQGDFDRLEESYLERSHLLFPSAREKRQIENLQKFFGLVVKRPFLLPLVRLLLSFPPNPLFGLIYRLWDSYTKSRKIFKIRFTLRDYLAALKRVLRY